MITLKQLRYFEALAQEHHFGRAADLVHISQPALSAQIMEMEAMLGVKLVERTRRKMLLTEAGKRVLPHARQVLEAMTTLEAAARPATPGPLSGPLAIGIIPTVAPYLIPTLIPYINVHFPAAEISLKEAVTDHLLEDLEDGKLDCLVAALPLERDGVATRRLFSDRFFMAVSCNNETLLASPLTESSIADEKLLLLEEGHCLRDQALAICSTTSRRSVVNVGATSMTTLLQMVANDMGMTLIPEMAIAAETARTPLSILPFAAPAPAREIGLAWRRSSAREADIKALCEAIVFCRKQKEDAA